MITKILKSFSFALNGLKTTWGEEYNFRLEILIISIISFCLVYFKFTFIESVLCVLAMTLILSAEIINTAVEDLCNKVEPQHDFIIGKIKDTMAGFVLVTVIGALIVGVMVFYTHFV